MPQIDLGRVVGDSFDPADVERLNALEETVAQLASNPGGSASTQGGYKLVRRYVLPEDSSYIDISEDENGDPIEMTKGIRILIHGNLNYYSLDYPFWLSFNGESGSFVVSIRDGYFNSNSKPYNNGFPIIFNWVEFEGILDLTLAFQRVADTLISTPSMLLVSRFTDDPSYAPEEAISADPMFPFSWVYRRAELDTIHSIQIISTARDVGFEEENPILSTLLAGSIIEVWAEQ